MTDSKEAGDSGRRWAALVALLTMLLTMVPYLIGWSFTDSRHFMWLGYNLDDSCVYLSWMRQAADGALRALNLFTTSEQQGMMLNPLFLVLGWLARLTHLPLLAIYHISRLISGFGLLMVFWEFLRNNITSRRTQKMALLLVCFGSGLGWLPALWNLSPIHAPIDTWQPEAITFLSLLLSPLFCFSMTLQIGILLFLQKGERTGNIRYAILAGLCGFVLGLVHTYDIITISAIWAGYLIARLILPTIKRGFFSLPSHAWLHTLIAGLLVAPSVALIAWELHTVTVFRERANVSTLSPPLIWICLGYGLMLLLSVLGLYTLRRSPPAQDTGTQTQIVAKPENGSSQQFDPTSSILLVVWPILNLMVAYAPLAFQRKMLQGEHFPIAILAAIGTSWLLNRPLLVASQWRYKFSAGLLIFLLSLSNGMFILREIINYEINRAQTGLQRTYLNPGEWDALNWINVNTPAGTALQPLPWIVHSGTKQIAPSDTTLACFAPGLINHPVYCGHWGETPDYEAKLGELINLAKPSMPDQNRIALLRKMKVSYLIFSQKHAADADADLWPMFRGAMPLPTYLIKQYENEDAAVYLIQLPNK